ncbi:T9SS type A sorting domain-containing protein [Bacteroidales bacterium OttesenSCG-928-I14]|nr:T9SS type A sorting domain-containing protein [Bacteroidales bacterium OttesenSCG-928-I14]
MITVNNEKFYAILGSTVRLSLTPDEKYSLSWIKANETLISSEDYSFVMPAEDVVITAKFSEAEGWDMIDSTVANVWSEGSSVYVKSFEDASIVIYNLSGSVLITDTNSAGNVAGYSLNKGTYLIKVNNNTYKVLVTE